jgi:hypothetical protein
MRGRLRPARTFWIWRGGPLFTVPGELYIYYKPSGIITDAYLLPRTIPSRNLNNFAAFRTRSPKNVLLPCQSLSIDVSWSSPLSWMLIDLQTTLQLRRQHLFIRYMTEPSSRGRWLKSKMTSVLWSIFRRNGTLNTIFQSIFGDYATPLLAGRNFWIWHRGHSFTIPGQLCMHMKPSMIFLMLTFCPGSSSPEIQKNCLFLAHRVLISDILWMHSSFLFTVSRSSLKIFGLAYELRCALKLALDLRVWELFHVVLHIAHTCYLDLSHMAMYTIGRQRSILIYLYRQRSILICLYRHYLWLGLHIDFVYRSTYPKTVSSACLRAWKKFPDESKTAWILGKAKLA